MVVVPPPLPGREDAHARRPDVDAGAEVAPRGLAVERVGRGGRHDAVVVPARAPARSCRRSRPRCPPRARRRRRSRPTCARRRRPPWLAPPPRLMFATAGLTALAVTQSMPLITPDHAAAAVAAEHLDAGQRGARRHADDVAARCRARRWSRPRACRGRCSRCSCRSAKLTWPTRFRSGCAGRCRSRSCRRSRS